MPVHEGDDHAEQLRLRLDAEDGDVVVVRLPTLVSVDPAHAEEPGEAVTHRRIGRRQRHGESESPAAATRGERTLGGHEAGDELRSHQPVAS
jgi:hypothetical protein